MELSKISKFKNLGNITTRFGQQTKDEAQHKGVDFANKTGTPIPAFNDGKIIATGANKNGLGNEVVLKDKNGDIHQYGHLNRFNVKPGQIVKKGDTIASMGATGNAYSPSGGDPSHLDVRIATRFGKWKNPLSYIRNIK
jgi:murein DD-endopeptidase MepM/ murein hydrolase activator NlpD